MADKFAPGSVIQTSFIAGEISPSLYGRVDLQKYHSGAALLRNMYVDFRGGTANRPGTQYLGPTSSGSNKARLIPFQFSAGVGQSYMLVFTESKLRFIKNAGGLSRQNGSNAGFIFSGGLPYEITTPYLQADLQFLKYVQVADEMIITRHGYPRMRLSRFSDISWTLVAVDDPPVPDTPTGLSITISALPSGSTDPQKTRYLYGVTAVDASGHESQPAYITSGPGINIAATQGTVSVFWTPVDGTVYYRVYKGLPTPGDKVPDVSEQVGFVGFAYGTTFTDSNIVPDFAQSILIRNNPFAPSQIVGYTITSPGAGYTVGGTTFTITDSTGSGAIIHPVLGDNTAGATAGITGMYIENPGQGYTAPTITAVGSGSGFAATLQAGPATGNDPDVVSLFQQRMVYASTRNKPNALFASRPGKFDDFRITNPTVDNDSFEFDIANQEVNDVIWMRSMPGGLLVGTNSGIVQLTGGGASAGNPSAVTPTNAVVVPQSYFGAADVPPIIINYDILYVQAEASVVRDLQYNLYFNIYQGVDVTTLANHLFYPHYIKAWAYQDAPNKIVWAVREDGVLLSLTFLKEQEVIAWTRHDTLGGFFDDVAVVRENNMDAVYFSILRSDTNNYGVERLCDRIIQQIGDGWFVDAGLSTDPGSPPISVFNGLDHFPDGTVVVGLADGQVVGPLTVAGGSVTLPSPASDVVLGLSILSQVKGLYFDVTQGDQTNQGRRKKITAMTARVALTAPDFQMGTSDADLREFLQGRDSTDDVEMTNGLATGDLRMWLDPQFSVPGQVFLQQSAPVPFTLLSLILEPAEGDTR